MAHPSFHDYEAQLAEQRARINIEGDEIVARFSRVYRFPLSSCNTLERAVNQARCLAIQLLDAQENFYDIPIRLLQLAAEFHRWRIDYSEAYMPHSIVVLERIAKIKQYYTNDRSYVEFASEDEYFFLELSRAITNDQLFGPIHVEWPKIGYGVDKERQFGDISSIEIQKTLRHLVFSFPPDTKWSTTLPTPEDNEEYWMRGTRLALAVHWDDVTERAALDAVARLMHGLAYTNHEAIISSAVGGLDV